MPLFRVCDPDRRVTKLVSATSLNDLIDKSRRKLNINSPGTGKIVLECDGAEVDDEEIFQELAVSGNTLNTLLMLIVSEPLETELDIDESIQHQHLLGQPDFSLDSYSYSSGTATASGDFTSFDIPWQSFPKNFLLSCNRQKIPDVSDRRKMIRVLADCMMQINPRPPRHVIRQIADEVVRVYPHSLADHCADGGRKSDSMFFYLENRIANCNRGKCALGNYPPLVASSHSQFEVVPAAVIPVPEECPTLDVAASIQPDTTQGGGGGGNGGGDFSSFTIPWNRFPAGFMDSCQRKEIPDLTDRRKMIRVLADAMMQINRRPPRHVIRTVAENVVGCFPISLADRSGVGNLYDSIFFCLDNRIAHCNRGKYAPGGVGGGSGISGESSSKIEAGVTDSTTNTTTDLAHFAIPWHKFPLRFMEACQEEAIPEPHDRREMIRVLADEVMRLIPRPPRPCLRQIAERLVSVYPKSLEDLRGNKCESIFLCLDNRVAHCYRSKVAAASIAVAAATAALDERVTIKQENGPDNNMSVTLKMENGSTSSRTEEFAEFVIPWEKFPASFVASCERLERPALGDRQEMVRVLAAEMMILNRRPPLHSIRQVARTLVSAYPHSLADADGEGHDGIRSCLENRIAHCNRKKSAPLAMTPAAAAAAASLLLAAAFKNSPPGLDADSSSLDNGCSTTTDEDTRSSGGRVGRRLFNDDVTGCSQEAGVASSSSSHEEKRLWLAEHFQQGEARDYERITAFMESTYGWQRSHIDARRSTTPLVQLRDAWPFLFEESFLLRHADRLLGVKLQERFEDALRRDGRTLVELCFRDDRDTQCDVSELDEQGINAVALTLLEALANHFRDDATALFRWFDDDTSTREMEEAINIQTPVLAIAGSSKLDANSRIYVMLEGQVGMRVTDFVTGLVVMFASYHCFNLAYAESCSATLEFIQLELMKIVSDKGDERSSKRKRTTLDPRVLRLSSMVKASFPV